MKKSVILAIFTITLVMGCSKSDTTPSNPPSNNPNNVIVRINISGDISNANVTVSYPDWAASKTFSVQSGTNTLPAFTGDDATKALGKKGTYQINYSSSKVLSPSSGDIKTIENTQKDNSLAWSFVQESSLSIKIKTNFPTNFQSGNVGIYVFLGDPKNGGVQIGTSFPYILKPVSDSIVFSGDLVGQMFHQAIFFVISIDHDVCRVLPQATQSIASFETMNELTWTFDNCQ